MVGSLDNEMNSTPTSQSDFMTDLAMDRLWYEMVSLWLTEPSILCKEVSLGITTGTTYWNHLSSCVGRRSVFQDDNTCAYLAQIVNAHLQQHNIYWLPRPAMSPLKMSGIYGDTYVTLAELGQALQEEWNRLSQMAIGRIICSIPWLNESLTNRGNTHYW